MFKAKGCGTYLLFCWIIPFVLIDLLLQIFGDLMPIILALYVFIAHIIVLGYINR
jgi:hypothetical protein